jgi:hypothetical protein
VQVCADGGSGEVAAMQLLKHGLTLVGSQRVPPLRTTLPGQPQVLAQEHA